MKFISFLKTWVVIYPSITLFLCLFGSGLSSLPLYQGTAIFTLTLVPWFLFFGAPKLDLLIEKTYLNSKK